MEQKDLKDFIHLLIKLTGRWREKSFSVLLVVRKGHVMHSECMQPVCQLAHKLLPTHQNCSCLDNAQGIWRSAKGLLETQGKNQGTMVMGRWVVWRLQSLGRIMGWRWDMKISFLLLYTPQIPQTITDFLRSLPIYPSPPPPFFFFYFL